jgi:protein SCO1/2
VDGFGAAEAVQSRAGEDERVRLAFTPLAQPCVDVAAHLDEADVRAEGEDHRLAARAGGRDGGARRQHVQAPVVFADEGVAGVGSRGDGGELEAQVDLRWQVFERMDGQVDATGGERVFDLLDEDARAIRRETLRRGKAGVLHAVADGADDLEFYRVAERAELRGDVVGLPERELGAARADTDGGVGHKYQDTRSGLEWRARRGGEGKVRMRSWVLVAAMGYATAIQAQGYSVEQPLGAVAQSKPAYLANAGLEQRLGQSLPLQAVYTDETGRTGPLKSWLQGQPLVIAEVYYKCAMLCPQVLHGLAAGLRSTTLRPGKDYAVLVFSIDPTDTPADAMNERREFLQESGFPDSANVHFLTGGQASIDAVSGATGFHFVRVPGPDGRLDQFAHSSVVLFATPDGRMSKYLAGIDYAPRDLRMAILDAGQKKISNPVDLLILYCCSYSPAVGKYSVSVLRILSLAGAVSLLVVIGMIYLLTRRPKGMAA